MGTNFYWVVDPKTLGLFTDNESEHSIKIHIGKRSYAGNNKMRFTFSDIKHLSYLVFLSYSCDYAICCNEYFDIMTAQELINLIFECSECFEYKAEFC